MSILNSLRSVCHVGITVVVGLGNAYADSVYEEIIEKDQPIARWSFDGSDTMDFKVIGEVRSVTGPSPPRFPLFDSGNSAMRFERGKNYLRIADPGEGSVFDFDKGDSITVEAWVNPTRISGSFAYIISKGRTWPGGKKVETHNWALRLKKVGGSAAVSFLFRSAGDDGEYHRWTSNRRFAVGDGWHHVAVSYTFGKPNSMRGYIDGDASKGEWDLGGATSSPPLMTDEEVWIGSSMNGNVSSGFVGAIDEVTLYRKQLSAKSIANRFEYVSAQPAIVNVPKDQVLVQIFRGVPDKSEWNHRRLELTEEFTTHIFALPELPKRYSERGIQLDRLGPFLVRAYADVVLPEGTSRLLARSRETSRLFVDGELVGETPPYRITSTANGPIFDFDRSHAPNIRGVRRGDRQTVVEVQGDGQTSHRIRFDILVGLGGRRAEMGEACVAIGPREGEFDLVSFAEPYAFTESGWERFLEGNRLHMLAWNKRRRDVAGRAELDYWRKRHEYARAVISDEHASLPSNSDRVTKDSIDAFINAGLESAEIPPAENVDDLMFLRRLSLDVIGTIPSREQIAEYLADADSVRRSNAIERFLAHPGWADHWVSYWQDVLAENPNIINPSLNNTGPFRFWIYESFLENKPFDRFVTELVRMEGSQKYGAPGGFELATENDVPMAAKAHILGQAFLGVQMQCARCHDAPNHDVRQRDLFSLAAMLKRKAEQVPKTSSINLPPAELSEMAVQVTLKPGEAVEPVWPFPTFVDATLLETDPLSSSKDPREQLAALLTSPRNARFARVVVNRIWKRYVGRGLMEPVHDWEHGEASRPQLLAWLADEFVANGYDVKYVAKLILSSDLYQREAVSETKRAKVFAGPTHRNLTAEQLLDSTFVASGKSYGVDHMALDIDGARPDRNSLHLGKPRRAWMFTSTSNERDRPGLSLPFAQPFVTFLQQFGWRGARQNPINERPDDLTAMQPAAFANGILARRLTRLSDDHALTALTMRGDLTLDELIDELHLRLLTRLPSQAERQVLTNLLKPGFVQRRIPDAAPAVRPPDRRGTVSWSNHLEEDATTIKIELQELVRRGDPHTNRLTIDWRERLEDALWSLSNSPEFRFAP